MKSSFLNLVVKDNLLDSLVSIGIVIGLIFM